MSKFTKEVVVRNGRNVIRWNQNSTEFVGLCLSIPTVLGVIRRDQRARVRRSRAYGNRAFFYVRVRDLEGATPPQSMQLFPEDYDDKGEDTSVTLDNERTVQNWYKRFGMLLDLTPEVFDRVSGNPYGRFDNSSTAAPRTLVFKSPSDLQVALDYVAKYRDMFHTNCTLTSTPQSEPPKPQMTYEQMSVFAAANAFPAPPSFPTQERVRKTHDELFKEPDTRHTPVTTPFTQPQAARVLNRTASWTQVAAWNGALRVTQQDTVMNGRSADTVATSLGLTGSYEWLHLVAHSFGPSDHESTPQNRDNLVLGTSAANSQMLIYESILRTWALWRQKNLDLQVTATCVQLDEHTYTRWLATSIRYEFRILEADGRAVYSQTIDFDPLQSYPPSLLELRLIQHFGLADAVEDGNAGSPPQLLRSVRASMPVQPSDRRPGVFGLILNDPRPFRGRSASRPAAPALLLASVPTRADTASEPRAYIATTSALGRDGVRAVAATLPGRALATLDIPADAFTFDDLFREFHCEGVTAFVFDNVQIHLEAEDAASPPNVVEFSGRLRMDKEPLKTLAGFLKIDALLLAGKVHTNGGNVKSRLDPDYVVLSSAARFHLPIADGVTLTEAELDLHIEPYIQCAPARRGWRLRPTVRGKLELTRLGTDRAVVLDCSVSYAAETLRLTASVQGVPGLFGINDLTLDFLEARLELGAQNEVELSALFSPSDRTLGMGGRLSADSAALYVSASGFSASDLGDLAGVAFGQDFSIPGFLQIDDVLIGVATNDCSIGDVSLQKGLTVKCRLDAHGHSCDAQALLAPDGVSFRGTLEHVPVGVVELQSATLSLDIHTQSSGKPTSFEIGAATAIHGVNADCRLTYEREAPDAKWNAVLYGHVESKGFGLATIFPKLAGTLADSFRFTKAGFVLAAQDTRTQDPDFAFSVRAGLQLIGVLSEVPALSTLSGHGMDGMVLSAHLGDEPEVSISAPGAHLQLGDFVQCAPFSAALVFSPPQLQLQFGMDVTVPKQEHSLHFDLVLGVGALEASGSITMKDSWWDGPFGVRGLRIGPDLALEVGINYAQFLASGTPSTFGISGGVQLGRVTGAMAVKVSENPLEEVLVGELDHLSSADLAACLADLARMHIPDGDVPDFFDLNALKLYCAPAGGTIGTLTFPPGFSFSGDIVLCGKRCTVFAAISSEGLRASGHLDRLAIGPLEVRGEKGRDASLDVQLTTDRQAVRIDGAADLLGSSVGLLVDISKNGASFQFDQSFLGVVNYTVHGESLGSLDEPSSLDFVLGAEFDSRLTETLRTTVKQKTEDAIKNVDTSIDAANQKVDDARRAYERVFDEAQHKLNDAQRAADQYLDRCIATLEAEKAEYSRELRRAQDGVSSAQGAYDSALRGAEQAVATAQADYDAVMRKAEADVAGAQRAYDSAMADAERKVDAAKSGYDAAMDVVVNELRQAQVNVGALQRDIDASTAAYDQLRFYEVHLEAYWGARIVSLKVALHVAQGALQLAQGAVQAARYAGDYAAFESAKAALEATRIGVEYGALETAKKALQVTRVAGEYGVLDLATKTLVEVRKGTDYSLWQGAVTILHDVETVGRASLDAAQAALDGIVRSEVYIAFEAAKIALQRVERGTEAASFDEAKVALEATRHGAEAMLRLGAYLEQHAGDIIDVRHVVLSARLRNMLNGELFRADLNLAVLGHDYRWTLDFDAKNAARFVENLCAKTLEEAAHLVHAV